MVLNLGSSAPRSEHGGEGPASVEPTRLAVCFFFDVDNNDA